MLKKLVPSFVLSSALIGGLIVPSFAGDDNTFHSIVNFPWKVVGCGVGTVLGVPLGAVKDGVKGAGKSTQYVAKTMGNEDGDFQTIVGAVVGGPVGIVGGAAYGVVDGSIHGFKAGYSKPFGKDSFTFKDE